MDETPEKRVVVFFFLKQRFYLFLDKGEGREKERERNINVVASHAPTTGGLPRNPGKCSDWESTGDPLVLRAVLNPLSHISQGPFLNELLNILDVY